MPDPIIPTTTTTTSQAPATQEDKAPGGAPDWKAAFTEAKETRDQFKARLHSTESELAKYKQAEAQRTAEQQATAEQQEKQRLESEGKYREILSTTERKYQDELAKTKATLHGRLVPIAIQAAAAQIEHLSKEALADLPMLLRDHIAVDETGEVYARNEKGHKAVDEKLNPVSVPDYIRQFVAARPYLLVDGMPKSHGASGSGSPVKATYEQALSDASLMKQWEATDPAGLAAAQKAYYSPASIVARAKAKQRK